MQRESPGIINDYLNELVNTVFAQALSQATDKEIVSYVKTQIDFYRYLAKHNPAWIVKAESGHLQSSPLVIKNKTVQQFMRNILNLKKAIISQVNTTLPEKSSAVAVREVLHPILQNMRMRFGEKHFVLYVKGAFNRLPPAVGGKMILTFYQQLYQAGPKKTGKVIRFMTTK